MENYSLPIILEDIMIPENQKKSFRLRLPGWAFVMFAALFQEALLHCWISSPLLPGRMAAVTCFACGLGCAAGLLCSLLPWPKAQKWMSVAISAVYGILCMVEYFCMDAYQVFMTIPAILGGAGGVAGSFLEVVLDLLAVEWWRIALMAGPIVLYAILGAPEKKSGWKTSLALAVCAAALYMAGFGAVHTLTRDADRLGSEYNFDTACKSFGLNMGLALDTLRGSAQEEAAMEFVVEPMHTLAPETTEPPQEETVVYEDNAFDLDYAALAETETNYYISQLHSYVATLTPTKQNAYTGLFAGKNLIFITAEAFCAEVIDPELTPTLYRLANEGIRFEDYYQPLWGGSTSTGEFSHFTGLVAASSTDSNKEAQQQDMFLTMGNQLAAQGYSSAAFHGHYANFYDRNKTHPAMGYDYFMGIGSGLEEGVNSKNWPESDLEVMEFTLDMYIDKQPFNVYYMTISGHCGYNPESNDMARKNYDRVAHLECSEKLKGYFACQLELEDALTYLVEQLEAAGIADDTVIVLGTDHYPYGLQLGTTWGNDKDYLAELYGYRATNNAQRDHSALIIWSGCIEDMDIVVEEPVYSLDILPTLSNLFGLEFDSRLLPGRDVFSEAEPLVLWYDYSWLTEKGFYNANTGEFIPSDPNEPVDESYIDYMDSVITNKINFCRGVQKYDYYDYIVPLLAE